MPAENQNFEFDSGDDHVATFSVAGLTAVNQVTVADWKARQYQDGAYHSISGGQVIEKTLLAGGIVVTLDAGVVKIAVTIDAADTVSDAGVYFHRLKVSDSDGHLVTVAKGKMTALADI